MRKIKKLIAVMLATLMLMTVAVVSASAAGSAPEIKVALVSETDTEAVVRVSLTSGVFNSLDFTVKTSSAISKCTKIEPAEELKSFIMDVFAKGGNCTQAFNSDTKKVGIATTVAAEAPLDMYNITLAKKTSAPLKNTDISLEITGCTIDDGNAAAGNNPTDVADDVKVTVSLNMFKLNDTSVSMNYKKSYTLNYETNYSADELVWTSSDDGVVTVDENGNLYATGTGSATVTVTSADGTVNESCEVNVSYQWWEWIIIIVLFGWIWY